MDIIKGTIVKKGENLFIDDEEVGRKYLEDWLSDILGSISPEHKAIEVRLKQRC